MPTDNSQDAPQASDAAQAGAPAPATSNNYIWLFGAIMLSGLLFLAWIGTPPQPEIVGEKMPTLDLVPILYTDTAISNEDLSGKLSVIHFWGTWCPPCQAEFPEFVELEATWSDDNEVQIVSVSCSPGPEYDLAKLSTDTEKFLQRVGTQMPTFADPAAMTRGKLSLLVRDGSFQYPTTLLVDREGTIIEAIEGSLPGDMQRLSDKIKSLH